MIQAQVSLQTLMIKVKNNQKVTNQSKIQLRSFSNSLLMTLKKKNLKRIKRSIQIERSLSIKRILDKTKLFPYSDKSYQSHQGVKSKNKLKFNSQSKISSVGHIATRISKSHCHNKGKLLNKKLYVLLSQIKPKKFQLIPNLIYLILPTLKKTKEMNKSNIIVVKSPKKKKNL